MKWIFYLLLLLVALPSCDIDERERAVEKKEEDLAIREQQLNDREAALQKAEGEFAQKQKLDSTHADSIFVYSNDILGEWNAKMVCTQTTCAGSAIGDTKLEVWTFFYENNQIVARVAVDNKLTRVYTGKVFGNTIELEENVEPTTTENATKIVVRLKKQNQKTWDGQREILRSDCKIVYNLQLTR